MRMRCCWLVVVFGLLSAGASVASEQGESRALASFRAVPGELSETQARNFYDTLAASHVLQQRELSRRTIDAIGDVIARTAGDDERKSDYLDGFFGLWSRVGIDVDPLGFANLEDRMAHKQGAPQHFGTLARSKGDYPPSEAARIYAAARDMIGLYPPARTPPNNGDAELAMATPVYPTLPAVREELLRLGAMDQEARQEPPEGFKGVEEKAFWKRMADVDAYTLPRIRAIFDRYGIPSPRQVGRSGTHAAFLLIQHAINDPALMRGAVAQARQLADRRELPVVDYALLAAGSTASSITAPSNSARKGAGIPGAFGTARLPIRSTSMSGVHACIWLR